MKEKVIFAQANSEEMIKFEEKIAYFFGAKDTRLIAEHYLNALVKLEKLGIQTEERAIEEAMIRHLRSAYGEVGKQTALKFDINQAAHHEFRLIIAQAKEAPFEEIYQIMIDLYSEVFNTKDIAIHKAALLRTFLYKYKTSLLRKNGGLSEDDQTLILYMAKSSEKELSHLILG